MTVFRITQEKYSKDLSGEGARLFGGRWNVKGTPVLYCASNSSLAMLEKLVHIPPKLFPQDLVMLHLELPKTAQFQHITTAELPLSWNMDFHIPQLNELGQQFVTKGTHLGLIVPSIVNEYDSNVVLNVRHPAFAKIKVIKTTAVHFDKRLINHLGATTRGF